VKVKEKETKRKEPWALEKGRAGGQMLFPLEHWAPRQPVSSLTKQK